jgi:prepilin-type N-terminal cleavage/methylation domain-containing protein
LRASTHVVRNRGVAGQAGFTIIELMVALAVMATLMAIAIPTVSTHMALQEIQGSAQQVVDVLRDARDSAMNEGQPRYVLFDPGPPAGYEIWRYDGSAWVQEEEELLHDSVTFSDADVTFPALANRPETGASVPDNAAYFDTRGRYPFGSAASYTLTLHGRLGKTEVLTLYAQTGQVSWG